MIKKNRLCVIDARKKSLSLSSESQRVCGEIPYSDWRRNVGYLYASLCAIERTLADQLAQARMITFMGRRDTGIVLEKREEIIWHIQRAIHALVDSEKEVLQAERDATIKHEDRKAKDRTEPDVKEKGE